MSVQCDLLIFSRWFLLSLDRWNERSCEFILVRTYVPPSVRTSVTSFCRKNRFFFLEILRSDRNLVADKIGRSVFAEKFFFYPYLHKKDQNGPKIKFS